MAKLSLRDRWFTLPPRWLDNREQEAPFQVRVRRLSKGELDAFRERTAELLRGGKRTAAELLEHFDGVVQGPIGGLEIDGEEVKDLAGLMAVAARESLVLPGNLAEDLVSLVLGTNLLSEEAAGN